MMFVLSSLGAWLPLLRGPEFTPVVTGIAVGAPDRFIENLSAIRPHFQDLGEEAPELVTR